MNLSKTAVHRPVGTLMGVLIALSFGFLSIVNLKTDLYPNMNIPVAIVMTTYNGAGSQEMENLITKPIEAVMGRVSGIKEISSMSSNGSSTVILEFESSVNIDLAAVDIREKIDLIKRSLPDAADDPMIMKVDVNSFSALQISATSKNMDIIELNNLINDHIADRIERLDGVASVNVSGGREKEIQVVIKEDKLRGYGISEATVTGLLAAENNNSPMGSVKMGDKNLAVRVKGEFQNITDVANIPITTPTGSTIYVRDIADIKEIYKDAASLAYTNGTPSINLSIQKQSTANTVNVSAGVLKELDKIKLEYPDISFLIVTDPADYINNALDNVSSSLVEGALLATVILYIFLRNFRSTLVVGLSMPLSVITTFAFMYFSGINLNIMSLGGLTLGIGMLVDNSIVVLESIYKKLELGEDKVHAAIEGSREVGLSITASTLTTAAVFLPMVFVQGTIGQMFKDLALTIIYSVSASLLVALTFVPMASSVFLSNDTTGETHKYNNIFTKMLDAMGNTIKFIQAKYKALLDKALYHKKITLTIMFIVIVLSGSTLPMMGFDFMPPSDEGAVQIKISLPKGSQLAETEKITWQVLDAVKDVNYIKDTSFSIGGGGLASLMGASEDSSTITLNLVDRKERENITASELAVEMRKLVKNVAGAEIEISAASNSMGSYSSGGVEVLIKGDDLETLAAIANDVAVLVEEVPNTSEVKTSIEEASPQTTIKINRDKASTYGISSSSVANIVRTAISGSVATTYKIDGDEYDIRIIQDTDKINFISDVESILIPTPYGSSIPLYEIAEIVSEDVPVTINRINQQKYVSVTANITNVELSVVNDLVSQKMQSYIMPANYTWEFGGTTRDMSSSFASLGLALVVAIALVYMVMAAEFEALIYPFIVMFSIPIAMTGGLLGLFLTGQSVSVTAFLGLIMLAGVVINNAIVLIDYANLLRRERGFTILEAMRTAGPARFRPIVMTTLTTTLGLVPMMISKSEGSEMMTGLATVVIFGLVLSTLVTLILIPVIYVAFTTKQEKNREKRRLKREAKMLKAQQN